MHYILRSIMEKIFDIGANVGAFTEECLKRYPQSEVVVIEPNDRLVYILKNRFNGKNVIILDYLVSTNSGEEVDFFIGNANTISTASKDWVNNSRFAHTHVWGDGVKKKTINLDELINQFGQPDLIKIDVEGYELEVIKGLSSKQKEICFEWAEEQYDNINKTCEHLKSIGYTDFGVIYGDDYLKKPETFTSWVECEIHDDIDASRKEKWGMIWVK